MSLSYEVKKLLQDTDAIWEALSIDGVSYPFDNSRFGKSDEQRMEIAEQVKVFDDERAICIANFILANQMAMDTGLIDDAISADAVIGAIIRKQVVGHMERIVESR